MHSCRNCGKVFETKRNTDNLYCDNKCQQDYQYKKYIEEWLRGEQTGYRGVTQQLSRYVRRYLRETVGTACSQCGWDGRHPSDGAPLTEVDHIDGNAANTSLENLRVLCPNCHSMTATFRARNKQSSRKRRVS